MPPATAPAVSAAMTSPPASGGAPSALRASESQPASMTASRPKKNRAMNPSSVRARTRSAAPVGTRDRAPNMISAPSPDDSSAASDTPHKPRAPNTTKNCISSCPDANPAPMSVPAKAAAMEYAPDRPPLSSLPNPSVMASAAFSYRSSGPTSSASHSKPIRPSRSGMKDCG